MSSTTDVIVIGGSIAGLMHAVVSKSLGRHVLVLEGRPHGELQARAAGLSLWPHAQNLIKTYVPDIDLDQVTFQNGTLQTISGDGVLLAEAPVPADIRTTSWALVHRLLWDACERRSEMEGSVTFLTGKRVSGVQEQGSMVAVTYQNTDETEETAWANFVIAADGARSFVRSQLLPDVETEYVGYLAWRGTLPEKDAPSELDGTLEGKLAMFMLEGSYILAYMTPSATNDVAPGERLIEWCWYDTCDASSTTFGDFMTDTNGVRHHHTVPAEFLQPKTWATQLARRRNVIPPLWHGIFANSVTKNLPLLTAIRSFDNAISSFYNDKLMLAGEALTQIRPHLGASCSIAALQALTMAQVLKGEKTSDQAQQEVLEYATEQAAASKIAGIVGLTGKLPGNQQSP